MSLRQFLPIRTKGAVDTKVGDGGFAAATVSQKTQDASLPTPSELATFEDQLLNFGGERPPSPPSNRKEVDWPAGERQESQVHGTKVLDTANTSAVTFPDNPRKEEQGLLKEGNKAGAFLATAIDVEASIGESQRQSTAATSLFKTPPMASGKDSVTTPGRQCHVAFRLPPYHLIACIWNHTVRDSPESPERATSGNLTLITRCQSSTASFAAADLTGELPPGWELETSNGEEYYVNHNCSTSTWIDPRSQKLPAGWKMVVKDGDVQFFDKKTGLMSETDPRPNPLPRGWEMRRHKPNESIYYINHIARTTTWKDPRDGLCPSNWKAIPIEWVPRKIPSTGRVYFLDRNTWTTTPSTKPHLSQDWPLMFFKKLSSPSAHFGNLDFMNSQDLIEALPTEWEIRASVYDGRTYFVHHTFQSCSFIDPRFAPIPGQSPDHWKFRRKFRRNGREPEVSPTENTAEELAFGDPIFNIPLTEQAMQSLEMRHARSHHTCLYCSKIVFDFRVHPSKCTEVWCAKSMKDVTEAMESGCPFFVHLFKDSIAPGDVILRASGVFLSIERYTEGQTLFGRLKMFDDKDEAEKMGEIDQKSRHYYVTHPKKIEGGRYGQPSSQTPALRLSGDPNSYGTSLTAALDGPLYAPDVYSWGSFAWAKELLDNCEQEHKRCNKARRRNAPTKQFIPTRLLDVRCHRDLVRIVDSRDVNSWWCCLSYVWGEGHRQVKTTKETLAAHMDCLPLAFLPPTIRDAIIVARWLKIRYIWIDSLCIIQDDPNDVMRELRLMPDIYRLALITISAASATGVGDGFLHYRGYFHPDGSPPPIQLRCLDHWGKETSILAFEELRGPQAAVDYGSHIEKRGWTFQERRISHRTLYYGPRALTFFCPTAQVRDRNLFRHHISSFTETEGRLVDQPTFENRFREKADKDWCSIVQDYSGRKLGNAEDKLTAIAAIAAVYRSWGKYMAGLWKEDLPEGLDWYVEPDTAGMNLQPRPKIYRAPTWSWASVDGKVAFWTRVRIEYNYVVGWVGITPGDDEVGARYPLGIHWWTKKVKATVQPVSQDFPFGPVKDASIVIKGEMVAVYWMRNDSGECEVVSHNGHRFPAYPDTTEEIYNAKYDEEEGSLLRLLGIARVGNKLRQRCGMVLQRVAGARYKRVGFFFCCSAVNWHESRELAQACEDKFKDF